MEGDTDKCFIPLCRTWPRHESNWKSLWGNYIYLLDFSYDIRWCKVKLLHFFDTFGIFSLHGEWHAQVFYTPCRTWPRDELNGKSSWGNYIYLLDFSYDIRWCKVKLLHFFDTFGIISLRWRVTRTSVLYPRVGHGPGMNRTEKVHEVTTCISSIFRIIFVDVNQIVTLFWHIWIFPLRWRVTRTSVLYPCVGHGPGMNWTEKVYEVTTFISYIFRMIFGDVRSNCYTFLKHLHFFSAVEDDTHKSFIPPCRTWPRDEVERKNFQGVFVWIDDEQIVTLFWQVSMEGDTHKCFIPPCTSPRHKSKGKSSYMYLLDFSYDIRWCKVKLLHFFDTFGIISLLRWRVKRTTLLYPCIEHRPGMKSNWKKFMR